MNSLKPRPPFQVLVMSEESRLGREAIETAYALTQFVQAGVRVFFYLEDRERTLDTPTDKIMLSLAGGLMCPVRSTKRKPPWSAESSSCISADTA
jgi:DNA invertase Pin-like site-specific DNA recombinase